MRSALAVLVLPFVLAWSACAVGTTSDSPPDLAGEPRSATTDKADGGPNLSDLDASLQHPVQDAAAASDDAPTVDAAPALDAAPDATPTPDAAPDTGPTACVGFANTTTPASCHCIAGHVCTSNGCYGGYYCDTTLLKCVKKPASCP